VNADVRGGGIGTGIGIGIGFGFGGAKGRRLLSVLGCAHGGAQPAPSAGKARRRSARALRRVWA